MIKESDHFIFLSILTLSLVLHDRPLSLEMNASTGGCSATAEDFFSPIGIVQGCGDSFDFTLTFEQYIFSLVPAAILLILAPFRITHLHHLPVVVWETFAKHIKLVSEALSNMPRNTQCN
jgi:hypothetical protein